MRSVQAVGVAGAVLTRVTDMQVLFEKIKRFRRANHIQYRATSKKSTQCQ